MDLKDIMYNNNYYTENFSPDDGWFKNNVMAKGVQNFLWSFSNLFSPRDTIERVNQSWYQYYKNIFETINAKNIIIIGSGLGVIPILALKKNMNIVVCDRYPLLARLSHGNVSKYALQNNLNMDSVKFINKDYYDMQFGEDIKEKFDVLLFDDFDNTLLETGIWDVITFFKNGFLTENAKILPGKVNIKCMAIEIPINNEFFNLSDLQKNLWSIRSKVFDIDGNDFIKLSGEEEAEIIDFTESCQSIHRKLTFQTIASGNWNACLYWYEICGKKQYELQYLDPKVIKKGDEIHVNLYMSQRKMRFVPEEGFKTKKSSLLTSWHLDMVNDSERNNAFQNAIFKKIQNSDEKIERVLDIGSGVGLLSMMAARANENIKVIACESIQSLSALSDEIIKYNGYSNQIYVENENILQLVMGKKVDLIICEVFATGLLGEGVLHFLKHAKSNFINDNGNILPKSGVIKGMLIEHRIADFDDINMSLANPYLWHPEYSTVDISSMQYKQLSEPFEIFEFDFNEPKLDTAEKTIRVDIIEDGVVSAIVFWFDLWLDDEIVLSTSPFSEKKLHWNQALLYLKEVMVKNNEELPLIAFHDGNNINFKLHLENIQKDTIIQTPRFDPQWLQQYFDIDKRYQDILSRVTQVKSEYEQLVDIISKIASDPAGFNIRGKYAARFAESFYMN